MAGVRAYVEGLDLFNIPSEKQPQARDVITALIEKDNGTQLGVSHSSLDNGQYELLLGGFDDFLPISWCYLTFRDPGKRRYQSVSSMKINPGEGQVRLVLSPVSAPRTVKRARMAPVITRVVAPGGVPTTQTVDGQEVVLTKVIAKDRVDTSRVAPGDRDMINDLVVAVMYFKRVMPKIEVLPVVNKESHYRINFKGVKTELDVDELYRRCLQPNRDSRSLQFYNVKEVLFGKGLLSVRVIRDQEATLDKRVRVTASKYE